MLCLPSGRIVDLTVHRSRYHALREQGPAAIAVHSKLYTLVDVVERFCDEQGEPKRGWTEYDYRYTGYTLTDIRLAPDWSTADKVALFNWVKQPSQYRLIETVRRRLTDNQQKLSVKLNSSPQHLYSHIQRQLLDLSLQRASVKQWRATIKNMQKCGLREEELHWSGLHVYLSQPQEDTILNKTDILSAIDFSNIRIELTTERLWGDHGGLCFKEVAQRMPHQAVYRAALKLDASCHCILRYVDSTYNYRIGVVKTLADGHHMALNKYWFALDPYGRAITNCIDSSFYYSSSEAAMAAADQHAHNCFGIRDGVRFHTRYDHLTLYGGSDYREWLVSLPDYQRTFFGAHHLDHNVLAHIRTTTRNDKRGRKLLFIEEVQSDWHQSGHRHGYDNNPWGRVANAPFKKEWPVLAIKLMLIRASQNGFDGIAWPGGDIQETRYSRSLHAIKRHYDSEIPRALDRLGRRFKCQTQTTLIETRDPWLNLRRQQDKWQVKDGEGKFQTRAKYGSREEAMAVLTRHCREIDLPVSMFLINDALRWQIAEEGLPMFGEFVD